MGSSHLRKQAGQSSVRSDAPGWPQVLRHYWRDHHDTMLPWGCSPFFFPTVYLQEVKIGHDFTDLAVDRLHAGSDSVAGARPGRVPPEGPRCYTQRGSDLDG